MQLRVMHPTARWPHASTSNHPTARWPHATMGDAPDRQVSTYHYGIKQGTRVAEKSKFYSSTLIRFQTIFNISLILFLYLLDPTYSTFIRTPSYQNFYLFSISFDNPLTTLCCLSFTGPYYSSSYTCSQPATGYTALLSTALWVKPCLTTTF